MFAFTPLLALEATCRLRGRIWVTIILSGLGGRGRQARLGTFLLADPVCFAD